MTCGGHAKLALLAGSSRIAGRRMTAAYRRRAWFGPDQRAGRRFRAGGVRLFRIGKRLDAALFEAARDTFQRDEAEEDVLVFGGTHVAAQPAGGSPQDGAKVGVRRPVPGGTLLPMPATFWQFIP